MIEPDLPLRKVTSLQDVELLCANGDVLRALRGCNRLGIDPTTLLPSFQTGMRRMVGQNRIAELLTFMHQTGMRFERDVPELLCRLLELGDHAGFLKQALRFGVRQGLETSIEEALGRLATRGGADSAAAYRAKFESGFQPKPGRVQHQHAHEQARALCDQLLRVVRRFEATFHRAPEVPCCKFAVPSQGTSASVYHLGAALKVYVHCRHDQVERLLEMAEHGQMRVVRRKDANVLARATRPLTALVYSPDDVELIAPIVAAAMVLQGGVKAPPSPGVAAALQSETARAFKEGRRHRVSGISVERNAKARSLCVQHYGPKCTVCGFDFRTVFGVVGQGFIHVHHLAAVAMIGERDDVDPIRDLRPVCPNCHVMLHRRSPPFSITELRHFMRMAGVEQEAVGPS